MHSVMFIIYLKLGGATPTMRLGLTVHRGNRTWSSLPNDFELNMNPGFEDVSFYMLNGATRRGVQVRKRVRFNNKSMDSVWSINNQTFGKVSMGYHPLVGEAGVHVAYALEYLAKNKSWEKAY
jgi:5-deoxy-D-glucuronate isomerase